LAKKEQKFFSVYNVNSSGQRLVHLVQSLQEKLATYLYELSYITIVGIFISCI